MRIESTRLHTGFLFIGVADIEGEHAWGLHPASGMLYRLHRDHKSISDLSKVPPPGWPDGTRTQVMTSMRGKPVSLNGHPDGAIIDTIVDEENRLAYRINEGPLFTVQGVSFPPEADLRKFAFVIDPNDLVVMEPGVPK